MGFFFFLFLRRKWVQIGLNLGKPCAMMLCWSSSEFNIVLSVGIITSLAVFNCVFMV